MINILQYFSNFTPTVQCNVHLHCMPKPFHICTNIVSSGFSNGGTYNYVLQNWLPDHTQNLSNFAKCLEIADKLEKRL